MGEKQTQAGSVHQERTGQKTRRSGAFLPHTLPRKPTIFLTAPLSHAAMAKHLGRFPEKLLLDFCSDLISIYPSYEGSKTIEYLQKPARWSLWRSPYVTVG